MYNELIGDLIEALRPIEVTGDAATSMCLAMELSEAKAEIEQLKRERDAAVKELFRWTRCPVCKNWDHTDEWCEKHDRPAESCDSCDSPEWRGVKEDTADG